MVEIKKRGQAEIITTVLLVLLVLAAIALITPFIFKFLNKSASSITAACLELDMQPISCTQVPGKNVSVVYKWADGDVNLTGVKVIIENVDGSSTVADGLQTNKFETKTQVINITGTANRFTVAGIVMTEGGVTKTCDENPDKVSCK